MAASVEGQARGGGVASETLRARSFRLYVALSVAGICGYFLLPPATQNIAFIVSNLVALVAVLVAWRRRALTPNVGWLLLAAFPAATAVGNSVYFVNDSVLHVNPFPSPGDAAFLGGYVLLAAGLLRLQHARSAGRDLPAVLDTAIITVGFAAASWVFFMARLLDDSSVRLAELVTALGYPAADVLIIAVTARFFLTSRRRGPVFVWLAGVVVVMLCADTAFAVLNLLGLYDTGHPVDVLILAYNLGWGAVALHPAAGDLTAAGDVQGSRPSWRRLGALVTAALIGPAVIIVQIAREQLSGILVTASASAVVILLVVSRMAGLVRDLESVLDQRRALEAQLRAREAVTAAELSRAAEVQRALLPKLQSPLPGYQISGVCIPSKEVGGDFFDWYPVEGGLAFTLGDVMGKGVGAGIIAATARAVIRSARNVEDPLVALDRTNKMLTTELGDAGSFATLFHARLRAADGRVEYVDAGHGLTILVRADGRWERLFSDDLPLGLELDYQRTAKEAVLAAGDMLVSFSDGVLDLYDGTLNAIDHVVTLATAATTSDEIVASLTRVAMSDRNPDDVTVLAVRRAT